uniref:HTH_48 domain-containing protein n=1 Tax=Heligmosomoides polygyrus TaxID=6339 RepID=A0A183F4M6_HELPZ
LSALLEIGKVDTAARNIDAAFGENFAKERAIRHWFERFRFEDESLEDEDRGRPPSLATTNQSHGGSGSASNLISGIGSFSIYYALFNATRFLFNYQTEKETASSSKTQQTTKSPVDKDKRPHEVEWMPVEKIKGKLESSLMFEMWFEPRMQKNQDLRTKPVSKNSASSSLYQVAQSRPKITRLDVDLNDSD